MHPRTHAIRGAEENTWRVLEVDVGVGASASPVTGREGAQGDCSTGRAQMDLSLTHSLLTARLVPASS